MALISTIADAVLTTNRHRDPSTGSTIKNFSGRFTITSAGFGDVPTVTGELRQVGGRIIGSLKIGSSTSYIPITLLHQSQTTLSGGSFTFVLPESQFNNFGSDGFFRAGIVTATVDAGFTSLTITIGAESFAYIPGQQAATASITLDEVLQPYTPVSYNLAGDSEAFAAETVSALEEVKVNKDLNPFENWGPMMGVERLPRERNAEFADRILSSFVYKGGSSSEGLLNAITRDLGLGRRDVFTIGVAPAYNGDLSEALIEVDDNWIRLYDIYLNADNNHLDLEIDLRDPRNERLDALIGRINSEATYFKAYTTITDAGSVWSKMLISQSNWEQVRQERIPSSTRFTLKNKKIRGNSIFFSDKKAFASLVATEADLLVDGDYFIDYDRGFVRTITPPEINSTCSYVHTELPFVLHASEAIIADINSTGFRRKMFEQVAQTLYTDAASEEIDGIPVTDMFKVTKELLEASDAYWGP